MKGGGKLVGEPLICDILVYVGNLRLDFAVMVIKCWCWVFCRFQSHSTEIQNDTKCIHVQNIEVPVQ
jgi:hypothetical protein